LPDIKLEINRKGRAWRKDEAVQGLNLFPARGEMIGGKLFWTEEERLTVLGLLPEKVGIDKAKRLGELELRREAMSELG
jgi:hypothetical protein